MKKLTGFDKCELYGLFQEGFDMEVTLNESVRAVVTLPNAGECVITGEIFSKNLMRIKSISYFDDKLSEYVGIELEEFDNKPLFFIMEDEEIYCNVPYQTRLVYGTPITAYASMLCEITSGMWNEGEFRQTIGEVIIDNDDCFVESGTRRIFSEEYAKAYEALENMEIADCIEVYSGKFANATSWKISDMIFTVIGPYIEVLIDEKRFFIENPNCFYKRVKKVENSDEVFYEVFKNTEIQRL